MIETAMDDLARTRIDEQELFNKIVALESEFDADDPEFQRKSKCLFDRLYDILKRDRQTLTRILDLWAGARNDR